MNEILATLMLVTAAHASAAETFECREPRGQVDKSLPVIVMATKNDDAKTGLIEVASVRYSTSYQVEGFDRYWLFGGNETNYQYVFIVEASGDAVYYDYGPDGDRSFPDTQRFFCELQK